MQVMDLPCLPELLQRAAQVHADREAVVADGQSLSYAELNARVLRVAQGLSQAGVRVGDRVLICLDNGLALAEAIWGCLTAGAVIVPVHATTKVERLRFLLQDAEPRLVLTSSAHQPVWVEACEGVNNAPTVVIAQVAAQAPGHHSWLGWPAQTTESVGHAPGHHIAEIQRQDLAALIYTSGTTADPKGVMLTHANMLAALRSIQAYLGLKSSDRIFCALPMCFSYGLYHLFLAALAGACLYLEKAFSFPVKMVERMVQERITVFPAVPTMLAMLLSLKLVRDTDWQHLRLITNAGAALPGQHLQQIQEIWPGVSFVSMYGLTECARASYLPPEEAQHRVGSVGRGMPFQQCWLVNEAGEPVPTGEVGELVVQGAHVMRGYWKQAEATALKLPAWGPDGTQVLRTGDLFYADADGYLFFVGRQDDIIKSRGEKVSPREVEDVLHRIPGVRQAAVIGVPDMTLGQAVHAHLVLDDGVSLSEREVIRFCLAHLESFKAPQVVHFATSLPHTDSGKVLKRHLAASPHSFPSQSITTS